MHVALNAHLLSFDRGYRSAGISRYIAGLLRGLQEVASGDRFTVLTGRQVVPAGFIAAPGFALVQSALPTGRPAARILWEQVAQPFMLRALRPNLLHSLAFVSPLSWAGPTVVTIYDLSFLRYPERFNLANRSYLAHMTRVSARRATRIAAISRSTREDVIRLLGVPAGRVDVVPPALEPGIRPPDPAAVDAFRRRRNLPAHFVLYLGTLEPRKNVQTLIEAYSKLRARLPEHRLVLAGGRGWGYDVIEAAIAKGEFDAGDVLIPGYVPQEEVPLWYAAADVFAYPSAYEGFGLPVLEALACGATVVCSNVSSLPEASGDAAVQVPPGDSEALAQAICLASEDQGLRAELRARGLAHAARFTPAVMGRRMLGVYARALAGTSWVPGAFSHPSDLGD